MNRHLLSRGALNFEMGTVGLKNGFLAKIGAKELRFSENFEEKWALGAAKFKKNCQFLG